jgi:DNA-binding PadR family transcriptional regulator
MWDKLNDLHQDLHQNFHERIEELQNLGGLRIWIIHILDENGPQNGVEIMDAVQIHHDALHNHGHFRDHKHAKRPSPGSVYPMLKKMVSENLICKKEDGRYDLTAKGQEMSDKIFKRFQGFHGKHRNRGPLAIENILTEIDSYVSYLENIKKEKLVPHEELIGLLSERLKNIQESLHED